MPVTQNYKRVTFSADAHLHAIIAVMTQLRADRAIKRTPGDEYDKFLVDQITTGTEALAALNAATSTNTATATVVLTRMPGALDGEMLLVVLTELKFVLGMLVDGKFGEGAYTTMRAERIATTLLFLENQK